MKKILTVSLVAVMAVSAAHAKIASVEYVEGASVLGLTSGQTVKSQLNVDGVVPAIKALQGEVAGLSGDGAGSVSSQIAAAKQEAINTAAGDATTKANAALAAAKEDAEKYIDATELETSQNAQNSALQTYADTAEADAVATAKAYTDQLANGAVKTNTNAIATLNGTADQAGSVAAQVKAAKEAAIADAATAAEKYIDATELETSQNAQNTALQTYADTAEADALAAANAYTDGKIGDLGDSANVVAYVDAVSDTVGEASTAINGLTANLNNEIARAQAAEAKALTDAKAYTDQEVGKVDERVTANTTAIQTLNGTGTGSVAAQVKAAKEAAIADAATAAEKYIDATELETSQNAQNNTLKAYADAAEADAIAAADTAAKAMIDLTKALTDCAQKQCALTIENGSIKWEEVQK